MELFCFLVAPPGFYSTGSSSFFCIDGKVNPFSADAATAKKYALSFGSVPVQHLLLQLKYQLNLVPEKPGLYPNARPKVFKGTVVPPVNQLVVASDH